MSREEYLSALYASLRHMPEEELASVMKYYEEYFQEAGPEREAALMAELGSPEELARRITGSGHYGGGRHSGSGRTAGRVVALICLSPLWLSLLAAVAAALVGLVGGVGVGGVAAIGAGLFTGWCGFTAIFSPGLTTTMFFGGVGLFTVGLGLAMLAGALAMGRVFCKAFAALCRWIFGGRRLRV